MGFWTIYMGIYGGGGEFPPVEPGTPACGFVFGYEPSTFEFPEESVVLSFSAEQTVLEFGDC